MKTRRERRRGQRRLRWLLLLCILLAGLLLFRAAQPGGWLNTAEGGDAPAATDEPVFAPPASMPEATEAPAPQSEPEPSTAPLEPVVTPRPAAYRALSYSKETYHLVNEMVVTYREQGAAGMDAVGQLLERYEALDPEAAACWDSVMTYWNYANTGLTVNDGVLPDGLPEDDSLCLVVLGYQLMPDGTMDPELLGRLETALASAEKYPMAWVLVTGGGTAARSAVTEAEAMASWLMEHGVAPERLIVEKRSLTTAENAYYSGAILYESYPQVRSLAIVSSDYHIGMGSLLFNAEAQKRAYETGELPYAVVSNAAFPVPERAGTESVSKQAAFVWNLMDPTL